MSRRRLTQSDVHKINTVRLQGDLARAHSRAYAELDSRREALEKELTEVNQRLEELAEEEVNRVRLLQERDVTLRTIAARHQKLNQELMKNADKNKVGEGER